MKITTELIDHISQLSRLRLPEEEKAKMAGDLEGILAYMDTLNTLAADDEAFLVPKTVE